MSDIQSEKWAALDGCPGILNTGTATYKLDNVEMVRSLYSDHNAAIARAVAAAQEKQSFQAIADHEGLLACRELLEVRDSENLYDAIEAMAESRDRLIDEVEPLRDQLAAAQADTKRLDWLEQNWGAFSPVNKSVPYPCKSVLREAIDAAINQKPK